MIFNLILVMFLADTDGNVCGKATVSSSKSAKVTIEWYPMPNPLDRTQFYYVLLWVETPINSVQPQGFAPTSIPPNVTQ